MLNVLRVGDPRRDIHERDGKWNLVYVRFRCWAEQGVWQGVWDALLQTLVDLGLTDDWQHMINSTTVCGHRLALLKCDQKWVESDAQGVGRMDRSSFSEEQIIGILKEQEAGMPTVEVCRRHGVNPATFYKWKSKFGGMEVSEAKRLRSLEDENARLKKLLAEEMLDIAVLKDITGKKW